MKRPDYKWVALGLLWVAFFLQQGTRQVYGPLLGSIQSSIGASDVQLGLVSTVFTLVYGIPRQAVPACHVRRFHVLRKRHGRLAS